MDSARTASLITNNVKKTDHVLVGKRGMSTPVLRGDYMRGQTAVSGILLTASAVRLRPRPVVRPIIP